MTTTATEDVRELLGRIIGSLAGADADSLGVIAAFADGVRARAEIESRGATSDAEAKVTPPECSRRGQRTEWSKQGQKRDSQRNPIQQRRDHCPKSIITRAGRKRCDNMGNFDLIFAAMPPLAKFVYALGVVAYAGLIFAGALAMIYFFDRRIF